MKKIYIKESKEHLLTEGLSNILYHFTSLSNGYSIAQEDKIYLQSAFSKDADNYDKKRKYYLSCTRIKSSEFGYSKKFDRGGVRIVLDGNALTAKYKGKQVNYYNGLGDKYEYMRNVEKIRNHPRRFNTYGLEKFKKANPSASQDEINNFMAHNFNDNAQHHIGNESEDRILAYEPMILDAHKYIISIDVLLPMLFDDNEKLQYAQAFLSSTLLRRKVKIFDSLKEFNAPNGNDVNEKIEYKKIDFGSKLEKDILMCLEPVIAFISYANPNFEGKNFGKGTMELLAKYGLEEYRSKIGTIKNNIDRYWFGFDGITEKLNSIRRNLSDEPSYTKSKILKMLTDYFLSIGANSFREACSIKKKMSKDYYSKLNGQYASSRIDTMKKEMVLVSKANYRIVLYPEKERFSYVMDWNEDWIKSNADTMAYDAFDDYNGLNHSRSKNYNSLRTYLYKLFRKGTVAQVLDALAKIGYSKEYLLSYNIDFEYKDLDYYEAIDYRTANSHYEQDYMKQSKMNREEIENFYANKQKVSNI